MRRLFLDFETRSPLDLKKVGLSRYLTEVEPTMVAWWVGELGQVSEEWEIRQHDFLNGGEGFPVDLTTSLLDPSILKSAFNAPFEIGVLGAAWGIKVDLTQWQCTMAWAYSRGFAGTLGDVGLALGLPESLVKDPAGGRLIQRFCKPRRNSTEYFPASGPQWDAFLHYNRQDVIAEIAIANGLAEFPWSKEEHDTWIWDRGINDRGLPVDLDLVDHALDMEAQEIEAAQDRGRELTGDVPEGPGEVGPSQVAATLECLRLLGSPLKTLRADGVRARLKEIDPETQEAKILQCRLDYAQSAAKKFKAIRDRHLDDRMYDTLQAWGAGRSGRWAGRGFQLQNPKRSPPGAENMANLLVQAPEVFRDLYTLQDLGGLVRSAIKAIEGKRIVVADLGSIESRVLGWLARCKKINDTFAQGRDTYKVFASDWLGVSYDQVTKAQRNQSKPPDLGCGYGLGFRGLVKYAEGFGQTLTEKQAQEAVDTYRTTRHEVPTFWRVCDQAAAQVVGGGGPWESHNLIWRLEGDFLTVQLPQGRKLYYYKPLWEKGDMGWGLTYMGMGQLPKSWRRLDTWGGKLTENLVQAIARDIFVHGLRLYTGAGGNLIGHVHDEGIAEEPELFADQWLRALNQFLSVTPREYPGLLLSAHGFHAARYGKE